MLSNYPKKHIQEQINPSPAETHLLLSGIKQLLNKVKSRKKNVYIRK